MQPQTTQTISNSTVIVEKTFEQKTEIQKRTWVPIEIPMPSYLTAERAKASDRTNNSARTWTSQEMIDAAVKLTEQRAQKLKEAQARLEEARALAMENARRAAVAANENNGNPVTPFRRAVNQ
jgi:multidrug efflux pump subunit AcrA (membrane-fusion protein)